jgi:hypothetical protein
MLKNNPIGGCPQLSSTCGFFSPLKNTHFWASYVGKRHFRQFWWRLHRKNDAFLLAALVHALYLLK